MSLFPIRKLADALGNPQRRLQSVLVAGTNGKGSTAAALAGMAQAAGYRTGLYTSPHLLQVNERIQLNREAISNVEFAEMYERVEKATRQLVARRELPSHPSFFEMLTAMMFEYFTSAGVDLAVVEVGIGGQVDATNIVEPCISIITDIDLDHQRILGKTLTEIASKKAGILRPGRPVVLLPQHPEVNDALGRAILQSRARPVSAVKHVPSVTPAAESPRRANLSSPPRQTYQLEYMGKPIVVDSPLLGRHQFRNVALAIAAAEQLNHFGFRILAEHIEIGARNADWPARFQVLPENADFPETVLDVAHNPAGAWALRSTLSTFYPARPLTLIFGAMRDKAISEIAQILFPLAERVIVTQAQSPRAASIRQIANAAQLTGTEVICADTVLLALQRARELAGKNSLLLITGSTHVVGPALGLLKSGMLGLAAPVATHSHPDT